MRIVSDLAFFAAGAVGVGWTAAHASYLGMLGCAAIAVAGLADFNRNYRKDLAAARKWREQRWNELKALETRYHVELLAKMPPTVNEFNERMSAAKRQAAEEIEARFGPLT